MVIITNRDNVRKVKKQNSSIKLTLTTTRAAAPKKSLINKDDFTFGVFINKFSKKKINHLFRVMAEYGLTVTGDGTNRVKNINHSVFHNGLETTDLLVFGKSSSFDVELSTYNRTIRNKEISKLKPVYELTKEFETILDAVEQYAKKKAKLQKDLNSYSRSMGELTACDCEKKKEKQQTEDIIVSANYIRIGTKFIRRNSADAVKFTNGNKRVIIPGCYWEL